jgi:hypothetical protein
MSSTRWLISLAAFRYTHTGPAGCRCVSSHSRRLSSSGTVRRLAVKGSVRSIYTRLNSFWFSNAGIPFVFCWRLATWWPGLDLVDRVGVTQEAGFCVSWLRTRFFFYALNGRSTGRSNLRRRPALAASVNGYSPSTACCNWRRRAARLSTWAVSCVRNVVASPFSPA